MKKILLLAIAITWLNCTFSQGSFDLNLGTTKTEQKNNALRIGVNYVSNVFEGISDR